SDRGPARILAGAARTPCCSPLRPTQCTPTGSLLEPPENCFDPFLTNEGVDVLAVRHGDDFCVRQVPCYYFCKFRPCLVTVGQHIDRIITEEWFPKPRMPQFCPGNTYRRNTMNGGRDGVTSSIRNRDPIIILEQRQRIVEPWLIARARVVFAVVLVGARAPHTSVRALQAAETHLGNRPLPVRRHPQVRT